MMSSVTMGRSHTALSSSDTKNPLGVSDSSGGAPPGYFFTMVPQALHLSVLVVFGCSVCPPHLGHLCPLAMSPALACTTKLHNTARPDGVPERSSND